MTEPVDAGGIGALAWLLLALPAFGAAVLLLGGKRTDRWGHLLGTTTVVASFAYGLALFFSTLGLSPEERSSELHLFDWVPVEALNVEFALRLDPLSLTFVLLITGVGSLIHVYSIGYMAHEAGRRKFFAYLNLFVAAMLLLVLGNGFVTLYFGWEGVGLASYLLIGWYQHKPEAGSAAKKAFLMNRVGDLGLAIAIFIMFKELGTTQYTEVFSRVDELSSGTVLAITLLLLLGACGKSGQFPLQAWLPDAMAGPTPVSALIHAATMVTAGVYLVARSNPLYNLTEDGRLVVMAIGAFTLLIGCLIGCAYDDFKKVLAYSTVSQIGYMVLAVGLGPFGYALGIMHLITHGFFKAGLFLGAGSVMHGMNDEGDIRRMGGLAKKMPITFATWALGYLALIGFPFLSGYFSKDAIIAAAFSEHGWRGWVFGGVAALGAFLTAFYMTRLLVLVFLGKPRWEDLKSADGREYHPHESPVSMTAPMVVLAIGSVGAGFFLSSGDNLANWLAPVVGELQEQHGVLGHGAVNALVLALSAAGAVLAYVLFGRKPQPVERPERVSFPVRAARADLYGNALNEALFARPGTWLTRALVFVDNKGVDGLVNGSAALLGGSSGRLRRLQTGFVRSYALSMLLGSIFVLGALLMVRFS
ncbi:proton-translocating NADH-quinone oxidoreductase, chain L [Actinosynnema mirum DSM 43827]|uniref:Proton-translocating NADH-quinone oxidoreductase, chain L n=1 Tax=Actinosynnema mirum (strain ATCC 29888 / DSM 43827 / JCM 3225 / NBRC 14064 / NCIMB 13271 / NRRL B-12336 / IMRU 3971 / 101) TaxID=446462 RepID=C6WNA4_ACTMD|nr:proton-translocating NADH-quinone oxidoreductase, chain L [Actinosynnema mirum DSM 43827]AXX33982.1 NADH-ubiquinone oxidoreductase chain L [Actinosynnema pretiosum subsp. pretiosum]